MIIKIFAIDTKKVDVSSLLTDEDLLLCSNIKSEETKREKIASLYLKKKYIGQYSLDEHGKPISDKTYFNVSHSHGLVLLAVSEQYPIGIDVELARIADPRLVDFALNDEEKKWIEDDKDFYKIWTSKEALLKAVGIGISKRLNEVPGLPLNGVREFDQKIYNSKTVDYEDYVVTITLESNNQFDIVFVIE